MRGSSLFSELPSPRRRLTLLCGVPPAAGPARAKARTPTPAALPSPSAALGACILMAANTPGAKLPASSGWWGTIPKRWVTRAERGGTGGAVRSDLLLPPAPSFAGGKPENRIPCGIFGELGRWGKESQPGETRGQARLGVPEPGLLVGQQVPVRGGMNGVSLETRGMMPEGEWVEQAKAQQALRLEVERPKPHQEFKPRALRGGGHRGKGRMPRGVQGLCPPFHPRCRNPWMTSSSFPYCRKSCSGKAFRTWPPRLLRFTRGWRRKPTKTRYRPPARRLWNTSARRQAEMGAGWRRVGDFG